MKYAIVAFIVGALFLWFVTETVAEPVPHPETKPCVFINDQTDCTY